MKNHYLLESLLLIMLTLLILLIAGITVYWFIQQIPYWEGSLFSSLQKGILS